MIKKIYIIILGLCLMIGLSVLLIYYTQDFKEEIEIYDSIKYDSIIYETKENYGLTFASAEIGDLTLKNNGYFEQKYYYPTLIGCINLNEPSKTVKFTIKTLDLDYQPQTYRDSYFYTPNGEYLNLKPGVQMNKKLVGIYNKNYGGDTPSLTKENIKSITIYEIERKGVNPFGENYYSYNDYTNQYSDCTSLERNLEPIATIKII